MCDTLDKETLCKIEQKLLERYDIDLRQAIENNSKLGVVLGELLADDSLDFIKNIKDGTINHIEIEAKLHQPVTAAGEEFTKIILESYGDKQKRMILCALDGKALTFQEIVRDSHVPLASCYRKIQSLVQQGLLVKTGSINSRKELVTKYRRKFEQLRIDIEGGKIIITKSPKNS